MTRSRRYLPFPLFLVILAVVGFGFWQFVQKYSPAPEPISINEIGLTDSTTASASACLETSTYLGGDIDKNGTVDLLDYNIFVTNFGKTSL